MEDQMEEKKIEFVYDKLRSSLLPYGAVVWSIIRATGWYVVGALFIVFFTYPYILKVWRNWRLKKDEAEYDAKYHKNPDIGAQMMLSVQEARERLYREYLKSQELAKEKEELEREKRHAKKMEELTKFSSGGGHRLSKSKPSGSLPLMGHGSSSGYRPPKRSSCGKGGCG